jgi:hypothetical protein
MFNPSLQLAVSFMVYGLSTSAYCLLPIAFAKSTDKNLQHE